MTPNERYFYGEFRLWQDGLDHHELPTRGTLQTFQGVDRLRGLVIPASPGNLLGLEVRTVGNPNPSTRTRRGFRAIIRAVRVGLEARSARSDPVTWVEDSTVSDSVDSYAAPTVTAAGHTYINGDVVLIRRAGLGLWSLATVSNVGAGVFDVAAVTGGQLHAIAGSDEIHLVEAYWLGMVLAGAPTVAPAGPDHYAMEIRHSFLGAGLYDYARTTATVGS